MSTLTRLEPAHPDVAEAMADVSAWIKARLGGARQFPGPAGDGVVSYRHSYLPVLRFDAPVPDDASVQYRSYRYAPVRGIGLTLQEAASRFQYDWDMVAKLPYRAERVWWRVSPTWHAWMDFVSDRMIHEIYARLAWEAPE